MDKESCREYQIEYLKKKENKHRTYYSSEARVSCTCKNSEFIGILSRHIFQVFQQGGVLVVPPQFILYRWKKAVKEIIVSDTIDETNELDVGVTKARRGNVLYITFLKIYGDTIEH